MKVIIPITDCKCSESPRVDEFKNASLACIYDCNTKTSEMVPIKDLIRNAGNLTLELKSKGIFTVISPRMSYMSLSLFLDSQLQVFKSQGANLEDNIQMYLDNQLEPFNIFAGVGSSGCSPSACSSCLDCN